MKSITIDIVNEKVMKLLKELEALKFIRIRMPKRKKLSIPEKRMDQYKGAMSKQPIVEVDHQLDQLRRNNQNFKKMHISAFENFRK